jgi:hypothetical protein
MLLIVVMQYPPLAVYPRLKPSLRLSGSAAKDI